MGESGKQKSQHGKHVELSGEGTAARTRPIRCEEIMLRRKKKELSKNVEETVEAAKSVGEVFTGRAPDRHESGKRHDKHHRDTSHGSQRCEVYVKDDSRQKEESTSREERLDKQNKKEGHAARTKMRAKGEGHAIGTKTGADRNCHATETKTRADRDCHATETKTRAERESHYSKVTDEQIHAREKVNERVSHDPGNEPVRKRLKSLVVMDRSRDGDSRKPEHVNKIKYQNGDDKRDRERKTSKKQDPGIVHNIEASKSKEKKELPKLHHHDMREKRRRSRSRDRGQDRHRRSSPLSRAEKAISRRRGDHEELSTNVLKDRPRKHNSDNDGNKVASTGASSQSRHGSKSGLGGYSPRKRKVEAPVKAPSPPNLSAEKRSAKWDVAPTVTASMFPGPILSGIQTAVQAAYSTINEAALTQLKPLTEVSFRTPPTKQNTSIDPVQLTESTRRMRRLYIENVPDSISEKSLIECFNNYLLSSGFNHIQGSDPCISCIINKEKGQALVEFLTPEDASSALSFNGYSFAGSSLKIRRPKDFVETTTGELEKMEAATNMLSDSVDDSFNKIFIGGISNAISSEMLMEIVSVFGPLKAYHFEINKDLNQPCAFLEYVDRSVTRKACAGLNGMKLGGSIMTVVQAFTDESSLMAKNENSPFYGIPEHAKPLLDKPTNVLKLTNLIDPEDLLSLSEPEVEEILEDVRLECARFGVIKSVNIVRCGSSKIDASEADAAENLEATCSEELNASAIPESNEESKKAEDAVDSENPTDDKPASCTREDRPCQPCSNIAAESMAETTIADHTDNSASSNIEQDYRAENVAETAGNILNSDNVSIKFQEDTESDHVVNTKLDPAEKIDEREVEPATEHVFEPGCIMVEYRRTEASCTAAHSLHGRLFDNRVVNVEYVSHDHYRLRFPK